MANKQCQVAITRRKRRWQIVGSGPFAALFGKAAMRLALGDFYLDLSHLPAGIRNRIDH